jgi:hypothetical protein
LAGYTSFCTHISHYKSILYTWRNDDVSSWFREKGWIVGQETSVRTGKQNRAWHKPPGNPPYRSWMESPSLPENGNPGNPQKPEGVNNPSGAATRHQCAHAHQE